MGVMRRRIAFAIDFSLHPGIWLEIITGQNICRQMQLDAGFYWISGLSGEEWIPMPARMVRHDLTKANLISIRVDILGINIQR